MKRKFKIGDRVQSINGRYKATVVAIREPPYVVIEDRYGTRFSINEIYITKKEEDNEKTIEQYQQG